MPFMLPFGIDALIVIVHCAAERRPDVVEKDPNGAKNVSSSLHPIFSAIVVFPAT